jgi:hypothetical protein
MSGPASRYPYQDERFYTPPDAPLKALQANVHGTDNRAVIDAPHVLHYRSMPNDADLLDCLADWAPDAEVRKRILADDPAELYGFE